MNYQSTNTATLSATSDAICAQIRFKEVKIRLKATLLVGTIVGELPSAALLAKEYGVSVPIVRAAIDQLIKEGLLNRASRAGISTRVTSCVKTLSSWPMEEELTDTLTLVSEISDLLLAQKVKTIPSSPTEPAGNSDATTKLLQNLKLLQDLEIEHIVLLRTIDILDRATILFSNSQR